MKVTVQDNLSVPRGRFEPIAKRHRPGDRRLLVVIRNYQKGDSIHPGRGKVSQQKRHTMSRVRGLHRGSTRQGPGAAFAFAESVC